VIIYVVSYKIILSQEWEVFKQTQHRGIGKMLMERVERLAEERNISLIGLASGFQRTDAHEFYEHFGYQKLSFWFRKSI